MEGLGFRVEDLGFRVQDFVFRVSGKCGLVHQVMVVVGTWKDPKKCYYPWWSLRVRVGRAYVCMSLNRVTSTGGLGSSRRPKYQPHGLGFRV